MKTLLPSFGVLALMLAAFLCGQHLIPLQAQGRGPIQTPPPTPDPAAAPTPADQNVLVYDSNDGPATAANGILAVTGSYGIGTSVLYVIDTRSRQLSVYEARGGSEGSRRVVHVGSRRIDLDLQLESFNDESKYSPSDLAKLFGRRPKAKGSPQGDQRGGQRH